MSAGISSLYYRADLASEPIHHPPLLDAAPLQFADLLSWARPKCIPVVRELTFGVAEEITEEGLPLLLLFHQPDDKESRDRFQRIGRTYLADLARDVNMVTADGQLFMHPLLHLGKTLRDLPIFCIDSFAHMYVFSGSVKEALDNPDLLKAFVRDLKSGKLHREFHNGPDPVVTQTTSSGSHETSPNGDHVPREDTENLSHPSSVFKRLTPSRNRYTILHDEF